jgi:PAS domain S-box-containing protein
MSSHRLQKSPTKSRPPDVQQLLREVQAQKKDLERLNRELRKTAAALRASERRFRYQFDTAPVGIGISDEKGNVLGANRAMQEIMGYALKDLKGVKLAETFVVRSDLLRLRALLRKKGSVRDFETRLRRKDGTIYDAMIIADRGAVSGKRLDYTIVRDVTEHNRAEANRRKNIEMGAFLLDLYRKVPRLADAEIYDFALEQAVHLTESVVGFLYLVADDQASVPMYVVNAEAKRLSRLPQEEPYPIERAGNWLDCVRLQHPVVYNDYPSSPNRKGLPEGHFPLLRFMAVPVLEDDKVRIVLGVGNKAEDYDAADVTRLQLVAGEIHKILIRKSMEEELRDFSRKILAVREDEKKRLAAALHHEVGSTSVGVTARLNAIEDELKNGAIERAAACLAESRTVFEEAMSRIKQLAGELRPPDLDVLGLSAALRHYFALQTRIGSLRIRFEDDTKGRPVSERAAVVLFRIAQEALTNVLRHAAAGHLRVRLIVRESFTRLSIKDDGKGFDLTRVARDGRPHHGMIYMKEMLSSVGGGLEVRTAPGRGTEIVAEVPFEKDAP